MLKKNTEIEFKTKINESVYEKMIEKFNLEENIFKQTNYYFDTDDFKLNNDYSIIRIRFKKNKYKLTLKKQVGFTAYEYHVFLKEKEALKMIEEGFYTSNFFDNIPNFFITFKGLLHNYRASVPYKEGVLFFDKCEYRDIVDYEIEYEANDFELGKLTFYDFLKLNNLEFNSCKRKSQRALNK